MTKSAEGPLKVEDLPEFLNANHLERFTGTPASTWRWLPTVGKGPASMRINRRRVWRKAVVLAWLAEQESATTPEQSA